MAKEEDGVEVEEEEEEEEEAEEDEDTQDEEVEAQRWETTSRKRGGDTTTTRKTTRHLDTPTSPFGGSADHNDDGQRRGWRPTTQSHPIEQSQTALLCFLFFFFNYIPCT